MNSGVWQIGLVLIASAFLVTPWLLIAAAAWAMLVFFTGGGKV